MTDLTDEERKRVVEALVAKADALLETMRAVAESAQPGRVDDQAEHLAELLKSSEFPGQRASGFRDAGRALQAQAHQRAVDMLFTDAERSAHSGDTKARNEILLKVKDHFAKALRYGAGDECRRMVERRIEALLLTTKGGVDDRTKQAAERKLAAVEVGAKPPDGIEHRRAIRYREPVLTVIIDGARYSTVNWSIRGLLIEPYRPDSRLAPGDRVRLQLSCAGIATGGRQPARVVRVLPKRGALALDFSEISTVILAMLRDLKGAGLRLESDR